MVCKFLWSLSHPQKTFFVNPQKFLPGESTKISAVQLQPFLHNDPFLLKYHLIRSLPRDDGAIKICANYVFPDTCVCTRIVIVAIGVTGHNGCH